MHASRLVLLLAGIACAAAACDRPPPPPTEPVLDADALAFDSLVVADSLARLAARGTPDTLVVQGASRAVARLASVGDSGVEGVVRLRQLAAGVRILADLDGLRQTRLHGFQILRATDCDGADPDIHLGQDLGTPHGGPYRLPGARHIGDLGNIRGGNGDGRYDRIDPVLTLNGTHSPVGRAVVVRAAPDDATSRGGGAGAVLACGVFTR